MGRGQSLWLTCRSPVRRAGGEAWHRRGRCDRDVQMPPLLTGAGWQHPEGVLPSHGPFSQQS